MTNWISRADKKPENDGRYLVYEPIYGKISICKFKDGYFYEPLVTYWQEIPLPPEVKNVD